MDVSTRDPYPFPQLQNDSDFTGMISQKHEAYSTPVHIAQKQDPWYRLNSRCTLSSARREVCYYDPQAPNDSLDFVLKAQYDHHREFLKASNETLLQPETLGLQHGRILKNRIGVQVEAPSQAESPERVYISPKKESIDNIHNAIQGHHSQITNKGYSRKPDGGLFTA
ncbi:protein CFAP276-like isoform X1 [Tubulanus polymorphus]|uniref:protein CFAP276-like isoform X1 n=1 Tax=Tubulanus polymorphus TaxID=672921 RepID=UPI003DA24E9D